ncbi:MAG: LPD7 domain-containing protein [Burkholderiales bacterium]|nr:hypothetical protein [Sulfuricellaceae bacterium]
MRLEQPREDINPSASIASFQEPPRNVTSSSNGARSCLPLGDGGEDERENARSLLQEGRYRMALARLLKNEVIYVSPSHDEPCLHIKIRGGMLLDYGDYVAVESGTNREISCLAKLLKFKGWQMIELSGSSHFREQALLETTRQGVAVVGYDLPQHLKSKLHDLHSESEQVPPAPALRKGRRLPPSVDSAGEEDRQVTAVEEYLQEMLAE